MLFKVMTAGRTGAMVKQLSSSGALTTKSVTIPPGTLLDVHGYANGDDTRFVVWNEQLSPTFFTVLASDCKPSQ